MNRTLFALIVIFFWLALFTHLLPGSTYSSPELMDNYFGGENPPGSWSWEGSWSKESEPFKYRLVFRSLVDGLASLFLFLGADRSLETYWLAFLAISIASHTFSLTACYLFLQTLGLKVPLRLAGVASWVLLPPILMPYMYPIQTKEDFIAYGLCFLAMRAMLTGQWVHVVLICIFGAFVRETLLFVSGIFLIGTDAPRRMKIAALALPIFVHGVLRAAMSVEGYDVFRESNLQILLLPIVAFAFAFGYSWYPLLAYTARADLRLPIIRALRTPSRKGDSPKGLLDVRLEALRHAFPYALLLLMIAHFLMGRIQEIRIMSVLSPFVLLALFDMFKDRQISNAAVVRTVATMFVVTLLLVMFEVTGGGNNLRIQINPMVAGFASARWWAVAYLQLILMCGVIAARRFTLRTS